MVAEELLRDIVGKGQLKDHDDFMTVLDDYTHYIYNSVKFCNILL